MERTFSTVNREFGDSVTSKIDTAMVNEVSCKLLCHNRQRLHSGMRKPDRQSAT